MENSRRRKRRGKRPIGYEPLGARGVLGIDSLPGGGLVSGKSAEDDEVFVDDLELKEQSYTKPELREKLKKRIMAGSRGGKPGQWSARKAQLLALEYERAGGGYRGGKRKPQRSLDKWTDEEWTTSDGKPAIREGGTNRYLPKEAWEKLTPGERAATNRKKRGASRSGRQFVANTERARNAGREVRNAKSEGVLYGRAKPRAGDPDVFDNIDAARLRARQLGCIGVARRLTPDGIVVWTPCTNMSDYRRRTGVGEQARRDRRRAETALIRRIKKKDVDLFGLDYLDTPSEVKNVQRTLGNVGKGKKRKLRPASFDRNANDADGDGLIQEGTTQERPTIPSKPTSVRNPIESSGVPNSLLSADFIKPSLARNRQINTDRASATLAVRTNLARVESPQTEAGKKLKTILTPEVNPKTGVTSAGNTIIPVLETRYMVNYGGQLEHRKWWAEYYEADPSLYSGGELTRETFVNGVETRVFDADHRVGMQLDSPLQTIDLTKPHLYEELFFQFDGDPWLSESGKQNDNPTNEGYFDGDGKPLLDGLSVRRDLAKRSNNSPDNPEGLRIADLIRWERPSLNKSGSFSYADSLGYFAALRAGYGEPYPKPDYSWVMKGDGKVSDSVLEKSASHILKKITEAPSAQPGLWRGETLRADYESVVLKEGDTFTLGLAGFSGSAAVAAQYAKEGTSGIRSQTRRIPRVYYLEPGAKGVKIPSADSNFPHDHEVLTTGTFRVTAVELVRVPSTARQNIIALQEQRLEKALSSKDITQQEFAHIKAQIDFQKRTLPEYLEYEVVTVSQESIP